MIGRKVGVVCRMSEENKVGWTRQQDDLAKQKKQKKKKGKAKRRTGQIGTASCKDIPVAVIEGGGYIAYGEPFIAPVHSRYGRCCRVE